MIDQSHPSRRIPEPSEEGDAGLEEARLRQQAIGVKLRHMFDQVVNEPVPDEFLDILRKADQKAEGGS
ncbi:MAG: NepR family anti-sigma factor [Brevundimonas sp.]|uniref:anti-sigma T factor NepR n=1 Tax=Brevundimonas sp. TaxID=1871086 RepID=UPI00391BA536